jgi:hypothetical protein
MRIAASALPRTAAFLVQLLLAATVLVLLAFAPPARGQMMLVPLDGDPISPSLLRQLPLVPERSGPTPGSLLVFGSSEGQFLRLLEQGVLILSAPQPICGASYAEDVA